MHLQNAGGLSTEELKSYPGFEEMNQNQLDKALLFIQQMAEVISHIEQE
jgi:hypothetical protein